MKRIVKKYETDPTNDGTTANIAPKGAREYRTENGKRMVYTSLGEGNWPGNEMKKPRMQIVKKAPHYDSKKRKVVKRKYAGYTDK
jgi:hypothetical protein